MAEQIIAIEDSILDSTKKALGIESDETSFDIELVMHINSVLATLVQNGIGPVEGFVISDNTTTWFDFLGNDKRLSSVKSYIYLKVRLIFDPPTNSTVIESYKQMANEFEWRNFIVKDVDRIDAEKDSIDKSKPQKHSDLLYELNFDRLDYEAGKKYVQPCRKEADIILNGKADLKYFAQILEYIHAITNNFQ